MDLILAFDCVKRGKLWHILISYGLDTVLVHFWLIYFRERRLESTLVNREKSQEN